MIVLRCACDLCTVVMTQLRTSCKKVFNSSSVHSLRSPTGLSAGTWSFLNPSTERNEVLTWGKVVIRTKPAATTAAPAIATLESLRFLLLSRNDIVSNSFGGAKDYVARLGRYLREIGGCRVSAQCRKERDRTDEITGNCEEILFGRQKLSCEWRFQSGIYLAFGYDG